MSNPDQNQILSDIQSGMTELRATLEAQGAKNQEEHKLASDVREKLEKVEESITLSAEQMEEMKKELASYSAKSEVEYASKDTKLMAINFNKRYGLGTPNMPQMMNVEAYMKFESISEKLYRSVGISNEHKWGALSGEEQTFLKENIVQLGFIETSDAPADTS